MLTLALLFYVLAYFPIWLWWPAPRHHYLPSVGLFAAGAVALMWVFERVQTRFLQALLMLGLGGVVFLFAAAGRGESRYWEQSFTAKRQMFHELEADLEGKEVLVLEDFPFLLGPAYLIGPHDANFAARLLNRSPRRGHLTGTLSSAPAPGGIFLDALIRDGHAGFRYYPAENFLVVRFASWENGRLKYQKNPAGLPYQVLSVSLAPQEGSFAIHRVRARREGGDLIVSLKLRAHVRPYEYLTAIFSFWRGDRFRQWVRVGHKGNSYILPVLLSDPGPRPRSGGFEWEQDLRLLSFPETNRVRVGFYAGHGGRNLLLGEREAPVA